MPLWTKWFVKSLSFLAWIWPQRFRWWFGVALGWFWFDFLRIRRFSVLKNISIAFPDLGKAEKLKLARRSMRLLCYTFPEFLTLPMMDRKYVDQNMIFEGVEHYEAALKKGKGVLLLSMHLGSGDMGIALLALKGFKVSLITKKFSNEVLNGIWFGFRGKKGIHFIDAHSKRNAFEILATLHRQEGVIFVIDQYMGKPYGIETTFFGRKTGTAYGLALFATKTAAPVIPVFTYRDSNLVTHLVFEPEIPLIENENRDLQIQLLTQKYNDKVEELIRRHPENWMWVHRRWKRWR